MARYNKIYAGPATENCPQVVEAPGAENQTIYPGQFIKLSSGEFTSAGASDNAKLFIAQDNYLTMKGVDDAVVEDGETSEQGVVIGMELLPSQLFNALVPTGNNIAKGDSLTTNATGRLVPVTAGDRVVATADEAYNNTSGSDQLVRVRAALSHIEEPS
jgi:hypothetical protein